MWYLFDNEVWRGLVLRRDGVYNPVMFCRPVGAYCIRPYKTGQGLQPWPVCRVDKRKRIHQDIGVGWANSFSVYPAFADINANAGRGLQPRPKRLDALITSKYE